MSCPLFTRLPSVHISMRPLLTSPTYISGGGTVDTKIFNFTLMYTKLYADFRSGLRLGCYTRTFSRYVICLWPLRPLALSSVRPFSLGLTSKVTDSVQPRSSETKQRYLRTWRDVGSHPRADSQTRAAQRNREVFP